MLRKVRLLENFDNDKTYTIPKNCLFLSDVCYEDGTPVIINKDGIVIKVGKHRFLKVVVTDNE